MRFFFSYFKMPPKNKSRQWGWDNIQGILTYASIHEEYIRICLHRHRALHQQFV